MISRSYIVDKIAAECRLLTIKDKIAVEVVQAYYEICERISWLSLRRVIDLDFSTLGTAAGLWLPASLIGIDAVADYRTISAASDPLLNTPSDGSTLHHYENAVQDVIEFLPRDQAGMADNEDNNYRWYYSASNGTPLDDGDKGMTATRGSATIAFTPALGADRTGEWVSIKGLLGFFRLAGNTALTDVFPGETNTAVGYGYQVRPVGQRMLMCTDIQRGPYNQIVRVFYWAYPPPLLNDSVPILVPPRLVELQAFIRVIGTYGRREMTANRYREEFEAEMDRQLQMNPKFGRRAYPRDIHRRPLTLSAPLFRPLGRDLRGTSR